MGYAARAAVKRITFIVLFAVLLWPVTAFAALPAEVLDELPADVRQALEESSDTDGQGLLQRGWAAIRQSTAGFAAQQLHTMVRGAVLLLGVVTVCGVFSECLQAAGSGTVPDYVPLVGTLAVTAVTASDVYGLVQLCRQTIEALHVFSQMLLPAMATAVTASGGALSASSRQVATVFFSELLIGTISTVFLPLVYCYIAASAADTMLKGQHLRALADGMKFLVSKALTVSLVLFTGYLSLSGAAATGADRVALQVTRSAISAAVPVVGAIISEASGSLLAGASALKSTLGIAGMLGVLSICVVPFLTLLAQYLLYKAAAFVSGVLGDVLTAYLHALGDAFGLLLGMTGSCAAVLLISVASSLSVVIL